MDARHIVNIKLTVMIPGLSVRVAWRPNPRFDSCTFHPCPACNRGESR
jgi:hypothetical protein